MGVEGVSQRIVKVKLELLIFGFATNTFWLCGYSNLYQNLFPKGDLFQILKFRTPCMVKNIA